VLYYIKAFQSNLREISNDLI
jgi:nucleosome assembly protein 1-like 1